MVPEINFDDIRPYSDSEVDYYINEVINDPIFLEILQFIYNDPQQIEQVKGLLLGIHTVKDLQEKFLYFLVGDLILKRSTDGITVSGIENLDKHESYLFISNHRDIILDSALMNYLMLSEGLNTTEVAIGNNLLIEPWIEHTVKLNRAFVVKRNLPARELLLASQKLSEYIRRDINQKHMSVWIAQREGRTKDGFDKTQLALLKMLNLSNTSEFADGFKSLRIVPLSISYEIEPCGISKVDELYKKKTEGFEKTPADDLKSMGYGLVRPKGRVHFAFGRPMVDAIDRIAQTGIINEQIENLANYIDERIYVNFRLWPNNYIAYDMLKGENEFADNYTDENIKSFTGLLNDALNSIDGDQQVIREMFLQMYANPVINQLKYSK